MELQWTQCYGLMCVKTKELAGKSIAWLKNGVDEYKCNTIGEEWKGVKIYYNYTADCCDRSNGPENQKSNMNRK